MAKHYHRSLLLNGPAGKLEASLWTPAEGLHRPRTWNAAALVCHPHPLYGGTMHNKVVFQAARSLHKLGLPVLRFNFRGVGLSEGKHAYGQGEAGDVRSALSFLADSFPECSVVLAGFSFGAWVGLRVGCEDPRVSELIGLGLPVDGSDVSYLATCEKPKLFVQGSHDQFGSRKNLESLVRAMPGPKRLVFVEGADHFFTGRLDQAAAIIGEWISQRHP